MAITTGTKKMKNTFKEFREKKKNKPENMETVFGSHSVPKSARNNMETKFGKHSEPKKTVSEEKMFSADRGLLQDQATVKPHLITPEQNDHIHNKVAPSSRDKMSHNEHEAITDYSDESRPLNSLLHNHSNGHDITGINKTQYKKTIGHLDNLLGRQSTTEDMHVYTGLKGSPTKHFKKVGGKVPDKALVNLPAFTSTSTSIKSARGFAENTSHPNDDRHGIQYPDDEHGAKHILKIHVPKGSHAMSIKGASFAPEENEILMHRGHQVEIHGTPEHLSSNTYLWHAKVVGHKVVDVEKPVE